jgi:succinoglycan biosynthesis transport protein ExoP
MNSITRRTASAIGPVAERDERHLLDYVRVLYKRRFVIIPIFLIVFTATSVNSLRQTPVYEARAQLLIEQEVPNVRKLDQMFQATDSYYNDEFYQTQYRILQSRSLAKATIGSLNLWGAARLGNGPEAKESLSLGRLVSAGVNRVAKLVKPLRRGSVSPSPPPVNRSQDAGVGPEVDETLVQSTLIDSFLGSLTINPIRNSRIVEIRYDSTDARFAAAAANALAKSYIRQNMEQRFTASKDAADWLGEHLSEQRSAVEASEAALQAFKEKNGTVSVVDSASNIVVQRLTDLNAALTKAKTERINKDALYNQLKAAETNGTLDTLPAVMVNEYVQKLKGEVTDLQRQQAQLAQRYGERHAEMIKIRGAMETAEAKLQIEMSKVVESVKNEYQAALSQERSLQSALDAQKSEALSLNRKGIEFGVLQREVESNRQIYESLLQRTKETGLSTELRTTNARVLDLAETPRVPISPNVPRELSLSFVASLVLAIGLAFFAEYLDSRLKTPQDVKAYLGVPFLGLIPYVKEKPGGSPLLNNGVPASFSEAFKTVRTNVLFSSAETDLRSLAITSASPGEGKSLVCANLAIALAQAGQRVLVIDADMRRPRVHELFDVPQEPGLSNVLTGNAKLSDALCRSSVDRLWVLSAGLIPPNPAELLGSSRYVDFLHSLESHFDWAIIDTPPVLVVADGSIVANEATSTVFVVDGDRTRRHSARAALDQLQTANAHVVGSVLNKANIQRDPHYYPAYYRKEYARYYVKR